MGTRWAGEEMKRWWEGTAFTTAAEASESRRVRVQISVWPNHKIPVGLVLEPTNKDDEWVTSHTYMTPDDAEAFGTALIYYARKLKGEI